MGTPRGQCVSVHTQQRARATSLSWPTRRPVHAEASPLRQRTPAYPPPVRTTGLPALDAGENQAPANAAFHRKAFLCLVTHWSSIYAFCLRAASAREAAGWAQPAGLSRQRGASACHRPSDAACGSEGHPPSPPCATRAQSCALTLGSRGGDNRTQRAWPRHPAGPGPPEALQSNHPSSASPSATSGLASLAPSF